MDKKAKKRIPILRERLQKLQKMLTGAKQQCDDPQEVSEIEQEIEKTETELA